MFKSPKFFKYTDFSGNIGGGQRVKKVYMCDIIDISIGREKREEVMCYAQF